MNEIIMCLGFSVGMFVLGIAIGTTVSYITQKLINLYNNVKHNNIFNKK